MEDDKLFYVNIPGTTEGTILSGTDFEAKKSKLYETYKDAESAELQPYKPGDSFYETDNFYVNIPGSTSGTIISGKDFYDKHQKLYEKYPDVEVRKMSPVNYWRDLLKEQEAKIAELNPKYEAAKKLAQDKTIDWQNDNPAYPLEALQESNKANKGFRAVEKELDDVMRARWENPEYQEMTKGMEETLNKELKSINKRLNAHINNNKDAERGYSVSRLTVGEEPMAGQNYDLEYARKRDDLTSARRMINDAITTLKAPSKYDDSKTGLGNFFRGVVDAAPDSIPIAELYKKGLSRDLVRAIKRIKAAGNAKVGEIIQHPEYFAYLDEEEHALVKAFVIKSAIDAFRSGDLSRGYQAGQSATQSVGFMLDFLITGGFSGGVARAATGKLVGAAGRELMEIGAKEGVKLTLGQRAKTYGIKALEDIIKTAVMTPMMPSSYNNFFDNLITLNDADDVDLSGKAILRAAADTFIENLSENSGERIAGLLGIPSNGLGKLGEKLFSETKFADWAKIISDAPAMKILKEAGFHGLGGELTEEWYGNGLRTITGVDKNALSDFATVDQQLITIASFAPMTLLGAGTSALQYKASEKQMRNAADKLASVLKMNGYSDDQIKDILAVAKAENPSQLAAGLAPVIVQIQKDNGDASEAFKAASAYARAVAGWRVFDSIHEQDVQDKRDAMRLQIGQGMGIEEESEKGEPWIRTETRETPDGRSIVSNSVRVISSNGKSQFVEAEAEDGTLALIDENGNKSMLAPDVLAQQITDGTSTDSGWTSLDDFLDSRIAEKGGMDEQQRMNQELQQNTAAVIQAAPVGTKLNVGTEEAPVEATVVQWNGSNAILDTSDGQRQVSAEEMAGYLGLPYRPKTDAELEQEEVKRIEEGEQMKKQLSAIPKGSIVRVNLEGTEYEYQFSRADTENGDAVLRVFDPEKQEEVTVYPEMVTNLNELMPAAEENASEDVNEEPAEEAEEDNTPKDYKGNPLPMKKLKSGEEVVDETVLWNRDPEAWVRWNDENRQDGGANSRAYLANARAKLAKDIKARQKAYDKETDFDKRNQIERDIENLRDRAAVLDGIIANYNKPVQESAPVQEPAAPAEAPAPAAEPAPEVATPAAEPATQQEEPVQPSRMVENTMTREEIEAGIDDITRRIASAKSAEERDRLIEEKRQLLEDYYAMIGTEQPIVTTRKTILKEMKAAGCSESNMKDVEEALQVKGMVVEGFRAKRRIFIIADDINGAERAQKAYVHERQHGITAAQRLVWELLDRIPRMGTKTLRSYLNKMAGGDFYKDLDRDGLADEVISKTMEIAYNSTPENLEENLRKAGLDNQEIINFVKTIDDEQRRTGTEINRARRGGGRVAYDAGNAQESSREDVGDSGPISGGILGEEGNRPAEVGPGRSGEGRAEQPGEVAEQAPENIEESAGDQQAEPEENAIPEKGEEDKTDVKFEENGDIRFSQATYKPFVDNLGVQHEGTREQVKKYLEQNGFEKAQIDAFMKNMDYWFDFCNNIANLVNEDGSFKFEAFHEWSQRVPAYKQYEGRIVRAISSLVSNGEYPLNFELSTDCIKREAFTQVMNEMLSLDQTFWKKLTPANIIEIQNIEKAFGIQVACPLCFVEAKRLNILTWAKSVADKWNKALKAIEPRVKHSPFNLYKKGDVTVDDVDRANGEVMISPEIKREIDAINEILGDKGNITDADARQLARNAQEVDALLKGWIEEYKEAHNGDASGFTLTKAQEDDLIKIRNRNIKSAEARMKRVIAANPEVRHTLSPMDLLGSTGLMRLRGMSGAGFADMFSCIVSANGTGTPKIVQRAEPYSGEIIDVSQSRFDKAASIGGARLFSFSDFDLTKVFDIMQIMWDCAARNAKVQSYSKEVPYILMFGTSGVKINMSMLPEARPGTAIAREYKKASKARKEEIRHGVRENVGLEIGGNGEILGFHLSDSHSVSEDFAKWIFHNPEYNANCGAIMVGIGVNHAIYSMMQPHIRMVIPFHRSGMPVAAQEKGDTMWYQDFTSEQNTGFMKDGKRVKLLDAQGKARVEGVEGDFDIYEGEDKADWDIRERCREYIKWCGEHNLEPKFPWAVNADGYIQWMNEHGYEPRQDLVDIMRANETDGVWDEYYKVMTDFTAYQPEFDADGNMVAEKSARHLPVTGEFNTSPEVIEKVFGTDASGRETISDESMLENREQSIKNADTHAREIASLAINMLNSGKKAVDMVGESSNQFNSKSDSDLFLREQELPAEKSKLEEVKERLGLAPAAQEDELRFSFAGEKGAVTFDMRDESNVRKENLDVAKMMEEEGKSPKEIKMATGWERGADKKWRYEIGDVKVRDSIFMTASRNKGTKLAEIIEPGSDVMKAYPTLGNVDVTFNNEKGALGSAKWDKKLININLPSLNQRYHGSPTLLDIINGVISHEIQHFIHHIEGFAVGANTSLSLKASDSLDNLSKKNPALFSFIDFFAVRNPMTRLEKAGATGVMRTIDRALPTWPEGAKRERVIELRDALSEMTPDDYAKFVKQAKTTLTKARKEVNENYLKSAGEEEARNVERRRRLTTEERRSLTAEETERIPRDEQVIRFSKLSPIESELNENGTSYGNEDVMKEYGLSALDMSKKGDVVTLSRIVADEKGKGNGTRFMEDFTGLADRNGWTLALTPDDSFGASSVGRLKNFYKRFGFKENKGRNADMAISESMVRVPQESLRFSITPEQDKEYMDAVESGDMATAQRMVEEAAEEAGYTIRGYHGTTHNFYIFDRRKGNAEGDWGKGFYFTNSLDDAEANYGNEDGPDLQVKISRLAENMAWMDGYEDMDEAQREEEARKMLTGDNPHTISAVIRMKNPVIFNSRYGQDETYFDYDSGYNSETDEYEREESGLLLDFINAWNDEMQEYEWEANNISPNEILEYADFDGLSASQLETKAREILDGNGLMDAEGNLASGEFLRSVFERMGFDGIIDRNVNTKFGTQRKYGRSMNGVDYGAEHVIAFEPSQIKQSDPVTYDDNGNVIPLSERFNEQNEDIRFSKAYHGSAADFDAFDISHAGEGEGFQAHGFGHYVTFDNEIGTGYAWNNAFVTAERNNQIEPEIADIVRNDSFDDYDSVVERYDSLLARKKADVQKELEDERSEKEPDESIIRDLEGEQRRLEAYRPLSEVFNGMRNVYTVEIPDDTGENYIDEMRTLPKSGRRRIADAIRKQDESALQKDTHGPNWLPDGLETLANVIEREQYAGLEIRRRLVDAFGSEKEASRIMHDAGFVGIKYNGRADGPCAVIFSNDDIQITEHLRFSKTNQTQNGFISNAEAALDGIQMEKATPEQWLKMLESKGGMKAGEDKWLGLSDWIKSRDKKTITKQEIADYIAENRIQIEEVKYGGSLKDEIKDTIAGGRELSDLQEEIDFQRRLAGDELEGMSQEEIDQWLTNQMVERYGDDFSIGYYIMDGRVDYSVDPYSEREYEENVEGETRPINSIRQGYTTEGLENKAEIALTVPTIEPWNEGDKIHFGDAGEGRAVAWIRFGDATVSRAQDEAEKEYREAGRAYQEYKDELVAKYASRATGTKRTSDLATDEENTRLKQLMVDMQQKLHDWKYGRHARERVLVIDEIQSKRHQEGRERGYVNKPNIDELEQKRRDAMEAYDKYIDSLKEKYEGSNGMAGNITEEEYQRAIELNEASIEAANAVDKAKGGIPAAPFEKNWHELAMKRMLRLAAEEGYDYVAWTTGEQQAERYSLSRVAESAYSVTIPEVPGGYEGQHKSVSIQMQNGGAMALTVDKNGVVLGGMNGGNEFVGRNLSDIVGKETAVRLMENDGKVDFAEQKIGGEGMKGFYDEILPRFMNKYGKKWGAKVSDMFIPGIGEGNTEGITMHSVPVTQEMKDSVMEGQLMFSKTARFASDAEEFDKTLQDAVAQKGLVADGLSSRTLQIHPVTTISFKGKSVDDVFNEFAEKHNFPIVESHPDGFKFTISKDSIHKFLHNSSVKKSIEGGASRDLHLSLLPELVDVIKKSIDVETHPDYIKVNGVRTPENGHTDDVLIHRLYGAISSDGKTYRVKTTIKEYRDPNTENKAYSYEVAKIEFVSDSSDDVASNPSRHSNQTANSISATKLLNGVEKSYDPGKKLLDASLNIDNEGNIQDISPESAEEQEEAGLRYSKVTDPKLLEELESGKRVGYPLYRAMQLIDGKLYPPMAAAVEGKLVDPIPLNEWEQSDERPDLAIPDVYEKGPKKGQQRTYKDGTPKYVFNLDKGQKDARGKKSDVKAAYNPYIHSSNSLLNDQFSSAWARPNLVVVRVEVPESEETSGYRAEKAKDSVGSHDWKSGPVSNALRQAGRPDRKVFLSRYDKPVEIIDTKDVADGIADMLKGVDVAIPFNTVSPALRDALVERGVKIGPPEKGNAGAAAIPAYEEWLQSAEEPVRFSKEYANPKNGGIFRGQPFWSGSVNLIDGIIEEVHTYEEAEANEFHHSFYFSDPQVEKMDEEENAFFWVENGEVYGTWRVDINDKIINRIKEQIQIRDMDNLRFSKAMAAAERADKEGIASVVGAENVRDFYGAIYRALPEEFRQQIAESAEGTGLDFRGALDQYISDLAEKGFENDETGALRMITDMLRYNMEDGGVDLDDNVLRYILWRSTQPDDFLTRIQEITNKRRWDIDGVRFSKTGSRLSGYVEEKRQEVSEAVDVAKEEKDSSGDSMLSTFRAMAKQRKYDKNTVGILTRLAKQLLREMNPGDLNRREVARLLGIVSAANGKSPESVKQYGGMLLDAMLEHLMKVEAFQYNKLTSINGSKVNASGVEVQGRLDVRGQKMLKAYKDGLTREIENPKDEFDESTIKGKLAKLSERMTSTDDAIREEAELEYQGYSLALEYKEEIQRLEAERSDLEDEKTDAALAVKEGSMSRYYYREFIEEVNNAIRENLIDRIEAYRTLQQKMAGVMSESIDAASAFREREKARIEEIHHLANSDTKGESASTSSKPSLLDNFANSSIVRFFMAPLATFDQMLRFIGRKSINGKGYLWEKYMNGWREATEKAYLGEKKAKEELDKKVSEVFGRKMRWSDLYQEERKMPTVTVKWWDDGEMKDHELTQGNLLYIYMVNKMSDGRMKLRRMGISEEHVAAIVRQMDPRFIELADWLQSEFMVERRNDYNKVHERLFGASMAAIDDYFPLKINKRGLNKAEDIGIPATGEELPATTTGSIIKRRRNAQELDLLNADAFSVAIEHVEQMEQWAAFAEFNRDINTLLSYKKFRNRLQNMHSVYGSGEVLWNNFKKVARIAGGAYSPLVKREDLDRAAVNLAKGVTSAKIAFRVYTALKQFLSMPAFIADANIRYLAEDMLAPWKAWNWAMKELPIFEKRWKSRIAGDTRLMNTESDWKFFRSQIYDTLSKFGMTPNAFVDAWTVSVGAHSMYRTKYDQYISEGYSKEDADKKAKNDATVLYNETQQSSEGAFVSPVQLDKTVMATMISVFRNSSMGYQRQLHDAIRNLGKMLTPGYKEESIEFMKKQMVREGLTEEQAEHAANRRYNREKLHTAARIATFGFVVQFAWNLGGSIAYLLFGDDDDEKKSMLTDALRNALSGGWLEGLSAGNILSEAWNLIASGEGLRQYNPTLLPLFADLKRGYQMMSYDPVAGTNELINLAIQAGIGVNPQTITDSVVAIVDACGGNMETSREAMLLIMRILQVPQSQTDQIYIDELGMNAADAKNLSYDELASRYARYKVQKGAPLTGWAYSDELEEKREKSYLKRFKDKVKERNKLKEKEQ